MLGKGEVNEWNHSHNTLQGVANLLYHRLITEPDVRDWLTRRNYFTDHLLWSQIADKCSGASKTSEGDANVKSALKAEFDVCMDAPTEGKSELCQLAGRLNSNGALRAGEASDWLQKQLPEDLRLSPDDARQWGKRLEAALLVAMSRWGTAVNKPAFDPRLLEITTAILQPDDAPEVRPAFVYRLRDASAHFGAETALPWPLHPLKKMEEYVLPI